MMSNRLKRLTGRRFALDFALNGTALGNDVRLCESVSFVDISREYCFMIHRTRRLV